MNKPLDIFLLTILSFLLIILLNTSSLHANEPCLDGYTAASAEVAINEINYRSPAVNKNIDFVELHNYGTVAVDLSAWILTDGLSYTFPAGTSIEPGAFLVVAQDPLNLQTDFGITGVLGPYTGKLNSEKDKVVLRDNKLKVIDKVEYESWQEWPAVRFLNNGESPVSIQKINPALNGAHPGSWSSAAPTPNAANAAVFLPQASEIPVVKSIGKSPNKPVSNEAVRIEADLANIDKLSNTPSVILEYQINDAGSYINKSSEAYKTTWVAIPMKDDGIAPDAAASDGIFTAIIPASVQVHRRLVRYRVKITTLTGYDKIFPDQRHIEANYAYYIYDGDAKFNGFDLGNLKELQSLTLISSASHVNSYIMAYTGFDYPGEGTIVYKGKVYDHIRYRVKGKGSRHARKKRGIKFDMNREHNFLLEDDCGKDYQVERGKLSLSGGWVNDAATHGFTESLIYKILELCGALTKKIDYTQFRVIDSAVEEGNTGDFWGIYLFAEDWGQDLLKEHNMPEGNFWSYKPTSLDHIGDFPNSSNIGKWNRAGKYNVELFHGDRIGNEIIVNGETNYAEQHSYREYYNSETDTWWGWNGDYDRCFGVSTTGVTSLRNAANYNLKITQAVAPPVLIAYKNDLRSVYDLLLNPEQIDFLVKMESAKIYDPSASYDWTTLDKSRWGQTYDLGSIGKQMEWYNTFLRNRANAMLSNKDWGIADITIPDKPYINLTGTTAINQLTFSASAYVGSNAFMSMEWRVGEWSDPTNSFYNNICEPIYEVQEKWRSGEISNFSPTYTIPYDAELEPGRTYKVRVRYKDSTGRWSHWSDPVAIVAAPANNPATPNIVINEIRYTDLQCGGEFIEIKNTEGDTVDVSGFSFDKGIDYTFPKGTKMGPGDIIVLAKDAQSFEQKYAFKPFDEYKGSLDDNGEKLVLLGWFNVILDSLTYDDGSNWDEYPSKENYSLELLSPKGDNSNPLNWFRSDDACGTPGRENARICSGNALHIVINEINYNSDNDNFDPSNWLELYNPNPYTVDISNWTLYDDSGALVFPQGTNINAKEYLVIVEDPALFSAAFPLVARNKYIAGLFGLSKSGERLSLFDAHKCLSDYVVYDDKSPWPEQPDGTGPSLALLDPLLDNTLAASWKASNLINTFFPHGTPGVSNICTSGQTCDDGDPCTSNDLFDDKCNCAGTKEPLDTDNDGVCNIADQCPGIDDAIIATPCDDGNVCTTGEKYDASCNCTGGIIGDIDNDGLCDPLDPCNNNLAGTACDDGDACTVGETYDTNCNCRGGVFVDTDNDSVCDADDLCGNLDDRLFLRPCNDGNPATSFDHYNSDSCRCVGIINNGNVCIRIADVYDDVEENTTDGFIDFNSGDIELINNDYDQIVGLRFRKLNVPQGAIITSAHIQFAADETSIGEANLRIMGQAIDDAPPFTLTARDVSTRDTTTASVAWMPAPWTTIGAAGAAERTTDVSAVISEIVKRPGYKQGNAIGIIIRGTGRRTAESYEGSVIKAPELCLTYERGLCVLGYPCDDGNPCTKGDAYDANCDCSGGVDTCGIKARILLEGYYNASSGIMQTKFKEKNLLPLSQPFAMDPWNYAGTESTRSIPLDIVDWILVVLRDVNGKILGQAAGFVNQLGNLIGMNGSQGIPLSNAQGTYICIHPRSHLAVMSKKPYTGGIYDFTTGEDKVQGIGQLKLINDKYVLYAGDYDGNGLINNVDFNNWKKQGAALNLYLRIDGDGSGIINNIDYNLWIRNRSKIGYPLIRY